LHDPVFSHFGIKLACLKRTDRQRTTAYTTLAKHHVRNDNPKLHADLSPCTCCYKLILMTLYSGLAAAVQQRHPNNIYFYYY